MKKQQRRQRKKQKHGFLIKALLILAALIVVAVVVFFYQDYQSDKVAYLINLSEFNLRAASSKDAKLVGKTEIGKIYKLNEELTGEQHSFSNKWYELNLEDGKTAYLIDSPVRQIKLSKKEKKLLEEASTPENLARIKSELKDFPKEYQEALVYIKLLEPAWDFTAYKVEESFPEVLKAELASEDTNLVQYEDSEYFRPYKWMLKNRIVYDGNNWYPVNEEALSYFLDTRNFLDRQGLFQFLDLRYEDKKSDAAVKAIFSGNEGLLDIVPQLMQASLETKYLPEAFASRIKQEVSKGDDITYVAKGMIDPEQKPLVDGAPSPGYLSAEEQIEQLESLSSLSSEQEKVLNNLKAGKSGYKQPKNKYFNFLNIGAYPDPGQAMGAQVNAALYAKGEFEDEASQRYKDLHLPWTDKESAIFGAAYLISHDYLAQGQVNPYLQKFDLVSGDYEHQYMQAVNGSRAEGNRLYKSWTASGSSWADLNFLIPVFKDMPEIAVIDRG